MQATLALDEGEVSGPCDDYEKALASISTRLEAEEEHEGVSEWRYSPYRWLVKRPPIPKSNRAAAMLAALLMRAGMLAEVGSHSKRRLLSVGKYGDLVVLKFCMTQAPDYTIRFQQIRDEPPGRLVACFAITPERCYLWLVPCSKLREIGKDQHGSSAEKWLVFKASDPPAELARYGGRSEERSGGEWGGA